MEGRPVPLSEHEQRILRQIERQFQHEHWLARALRVPEDAHVATRNAKRAAGGFVLGLSALLLSFASSWVVGLVGFIIMLASAVSLVQSIRCLLEHRYSKSLPPSPSEDGARPLGERPGRGPGSRWWAGHGNSRDGGAEPPA